MARDDFSSNRHLDLSFCLSMIFSENGYPTHRVVAAQCTFGACFWGHAFPDHALDFPDIAGDKFGANASREGVDVRRPGPYLDTFLLHAR